MTETSAPQPSEKEVNVRHHVYRIMDKHLESAFEELDHLHKRDIHDSEVIKALRDGHYTSEADAYIEWAQCIDPDVDPTPQGEELVTDPADAPSYADHPLNQPPAEDIREDADLAGEWTNGLATIELTRRPIGNVGGYPLIGVAWIATQRDTLVGSRSLLITPAGLRDAGYRRVQG